MKVDVTVSSKISSSSRVRQLEGMFDVPPEEKSTLSWQGEVPVEDEPWSVGLIVGPSGCGKSILLKQCFGGEKKLRWGRSSVVDDFDEKFSMKEVAAVCQAVGFNTIPAWTRPFRVLSNGEQFRAELARRLLETDGTIVVDEFTSVVDRQVAKIGSHAVQKYVRKNGKQFVAASCHHDVIDWLQPDWVLEPSTMTFRRRSLQRRPTVDVVVGRVSPAAWELFAPFHYMSAKLNPTARCFGLWANDQLASFTCVLYLPHPRVKNIYRLHRSVTLPDWQGMGLIHVLCERVGAAYRAVGKRLRAYPAHPAFIRARNQSPLWAMIKRPGTFSPRTGVSSSLVGGGSFGGRSCAVFEYAGPKMKPAEARAFLETAGE